MELEDIMRHARQTFSKVQTDTFRVGHEQMIDLYSVVERIATDLPVHADCDKLSQRSFARVLIDGYMDEIHQILSVDAGADAPILVYIALNFTWKKHFRHFSVGEMRIWMVHSDNEVLQQNPRPFQLFRCVSTHNKIRMDEILPERDVVLLRRFAVSRPILTSNMKPIFDTARALFKDGSTKDLNKFASLIGTRQNDTILYFSGSFYSKKDDIGDAFIIKLNISDEKHSHHYAIRIPGDKPDVVRSFEDKLFRVAKDPIKKLRSYAARKELPFIENVYHVPENVLLFFYDALRSSSWNDLGDVVLEAQEQWTKFPPYSGIFPIYFALCIEGNTFHIAVYSPKHNVNIETFVLVYDDELVDRRRRFFPDKTYVKDVREYALDPSRQLKPEDSFLKPYIHAHRLNIISQKVRLPADKSVPSKLAADVEKWRKHYRKKLRQHVSKHPMDAARLKQILPSYADEIEDVAFEKAVNQYVHSTQQVPADHPFRQKIQQERRRVRQQAVKHTKEIADMVRKSHLQKAIDQFVYKNPMQQVPSDHPFHQQIQQERRRRTRQQAVKHTKKIADMVRKSHLQKAVRQFVYKNPTQQVPADHPFHQQIQQERRRARQQAAKHDTPDDLAQALLKDLNLIDPISDEPIREPVRSPYNPTGIYDKSTLSRWLSKGARLDPISSQVMPATFEPKTDQQLKKFTQQLYPKIQQIMKQEDDEVKKLRLLGLKKQLQQKQVFQNTIRKSFQN